MSEGIRGWRAGFGFKQVADDIDRGVEPLGRTGQGDAFLLPE
jgi:hypothetical protein